MLGQCALGFLAGLLTSFFAEHREEERIDPKLALLAKRLKPIESAFMNRRERGSGKMSSLRSSLYTLARLMGDINAVKKGRVGRRIGRRIAGRVTGKTLGRLFR